MSAAATATQRSTEEKKSVPVTVQSTDYTVNNKKSYLIAKRIFDIIISALGSIVLLLPMAVVAILIWLESPGPVIYKQERMGKGNQPFVMYKFRSMRLDSEKDGPQWAEDHDDRCTKVGRIIRLLHIDELPQLWNILKGDMSIVGPRPEREYFYNEFEKDIPNFRERLRVKPGLTGHAQVNGGYDLTPAEKLVYDIEYMQKRSLWFDFKCVLKTFLVIFNHKGAR